MTAAGTAAAAAGCAAAAAAMREACAGAVLDGLTRRPVRQLDDLLQVGLVPVQQGGGRRFNMHWPLEHWIGTSCCKLLDAWPDPAGVLLATVQGAVQTSMR